MGSAGSTSQLVQAMAGFGGGSGAGESLNTVPLSADITAAVADGTAARMKGSFQRKAPATGLELNG
jgi:hypothetical protein